MFLLSHVKILGKQKKILASYNFTNNLISYNKHNFKNRIPKIIQGLNSEESVALVSDAGMPSICDPGEDLIRAARSNGLHIICIPGPCAGITALVSSGLPSSKFIFEGFLPKKNSEREKILLEIMKSPKTTILYESPHRLKKLLSELKIICGGERKIKVFRELTKRYEEHIGNNIDEVIKFFESKEIKGEITIIIGGFDKPETNSFDEINLRKELHLLVKAGLSLSSASKYLAKKENITKSIIYNLY